MFQACTKKLLLVLIFSISSVLIAEDYQPGKHYQVLSEPIATRDSKKSRSSNSSGLGAVIVTV